MHSKKDQPVELELPFELMKNPDQPKKTVDPFELGFSGFELRYESVETSKFEVNLHSIELLYDPMAPRVMMHYAGNHFYEANIYEKRMANLFKGEGAVSKQSARNTQNTPDELYNSLIREKK